MLTRNPQLYSDKENTDWSRMAAQKWLAWPVYISPPFYIVLALFMPWYKLYALIFIAFLLWSLFVIFSNHFVNIIAFYIGEATRKKRLIEVLWFLVFFYLLYNWRIMDLIFACVYLALSVEGDLYYYALRLLTFLNLYTGVFRGPIIEPVFVRFMSSLGYETE